MNNNFFTNLYTKEAQEKLITKINYLGSNNSLNLDKFITKRIVISFIILLLPIILFNAWFIGVILSVLYYFLYEYLTLDYKIKLRINTLEKDSVFIFEMLYLTMDSTNSLKNSLNLITEKFDNELNDEIKNILQSVNCGKSFKEAIDDTLKFIPSIHVKTVLNSLKESYELGSPIKKTISNILDYLKDKIYYKEKENINKIPLKFSLISLCIYIPIIVLLILTPYLINLL